MLNASLALSAALLLAPDPSPRGDDILCLKDGRIFEGLQMESQPDGGLLIHFENGDVKVPQALVLEALVNGESTYEPTTPEEKEKWEQGLVPYEGKWVKPDKRQREIEKRVKDLLANIEEMQAYRLWRNRRTEKTAHFEFEYTVPQHVFEEFRDLMEAYFSEFARTWRIKMPKDGRLKICFYRSREDFHQISAASGGVVGYFRFVKPWELNIFHERTDRVFTEQVMFHEANHYLQKLLDPEVNMPHFPGESIAEYYGASQYDPATGKITTGMILDGRLTEIQNDIAADNLLGLKEMILSDEDYKHYTWGWSLVHFLMNDARTQKQFVKFAMALVRGKDVERRKGSWNLYDVSTEEVWAAFQRYMGLKDDADVTRMQEAWHTYVKEHLQLVTARGLEKAAMAAARQYPPRPLRARRLFEEAIAKGTGNPLTFHQYAELLAREDKYADALAMWQKAVDLDPLNASFYASMGRTMTLQGKAREGKVLIALAREIDPDVDDDVWGVSAF